MKIKNFIIVGCLLAMASCSTEIEVDAPDFQVSTTSNTFQVGEEVTFSFTGDADMISFYSGELYRNYENRDGRVVNIGNSYVLLEFSTDVSGGTQEDQLSLLASTDFNGNYEDLQSVKSATWIDITDRFNIIDSTGFVSSTAQDISDLVQNGGPIYFAFRYETKSQADNGLARNWAIQNFRLIDTTTTIEGEEVELEIIDQVNTGFRIVESDRENAPSRSVITTTRVALLGNVYWHPDDPIFDPENPIYDPENPIYDPEADEYQPGVEMPEYVPYDPNSPYNDPNTETWAVSGPIILNEVDLGPDRPRVIKAVRNTKMDDYTYSYSTPGQYTAYFVARNTSIDDIKEVVRSVNLTITP